MGITIHYEVGYDGPFTTIKRKLEAVAQELQKMKPVQVVSDDSLLSCDIMEGSEWFVLDFLNKRYADPQYRDDKLKESAHYARGFTKTTYADDPVKAHFTVIVGLCALMEQGFTVRVNDEADFWKGCSIQGYTDDDLKRLATMFGRDHRMLAAIAGQIKDAIGGELVAPITERPDFEHLEAEGRKEQEE